MSRYEYGMDDATGEYGPLDEDGHIVRKAAPAVPAGYVAVSLSQRDFNRGLKYARSCGGKYQPATRTWLIPAGRPELGAPAAYGWVICR